MRQTSSMGKARRLKRIFSGKNNLVIVPVDDSLLAGPTQGLENLQSKLPLIIEGCPDVIMGFQGSFRRFSNLLHEVPAILNITASTTRSLHTRKVLVGSVKQAIQMGLDGVAVHVNIGSRFESEMLKIMGKVSQDCEKYGMPLLAIMYPRTEAQDGTDENYLELRDNDRGKYAQLVAHAARVGLEMGADLIKTQYTGDVESFKQVLDACDPIPVVVAGGPAVSAETMLEMAYNVVQAGGGGVSFGRNVFSRTNPIPYIKALKLVVHQKLSPTEATTIALGSAS